MARLSISSSGSILAIAGADGSSEALSDATRYVSAVSDALRVRALTAGLRAYLQRVRQQAMSSAPFALFREARGYRMSARQGRSGEVYGYLLSAGYGNTLEAGAAGHWAPIGDAIEKSGAVTPGMRAWLQAHAPQLLASPTARYIHVHTRQGTPWVIPAGDQAAGAAVSAFNDAVLKELSRID